LYATLELRHRVDKNYRHIITTRRLIPFAEVLRMVFKKGTGSSPTFKLWLDVRRDIAELELRWGALSMRMTAEKPDFSEMSKKLRLAFCKRFFFSFFPMLLARFYVLNKRFVNERYPQISDIDVYTQSGKISFELYRAENSLVLLTLGPWGRASDITDFYPEKESFALIAQKVWEEIVSNIEKLGW